MGTGKPILRRFCSSICARASASDGSSSTSGWRQNLQTIAVGAICSRQYGHCSVPNARPRPTPRKTMNLMIRNRTAASIMKLIRSVRNAPYLIFAPLISKSNV